MMWDVLKSEYVKKKKKILISKQIGIFAQVDAYALFYLSNYIPKLEKDKLNK